MLAYWRTHHTFERSINERPKDKPFTFYDGPPFATGLPHYGHIVASTIKDVVPRYKTMRGFRVERRWGWDCHGLPVENLIEKELNLKTKKDIEAIGVSKFNDACRTSVLKYTKEWRATIERLGRWVDMDNDYRTMDASYTESIWWAFKRLYEQGLIYEGKKAMHLCPRCETTLSNFEVTLGYKDITDYSVVAQFQLVDEPGTYILAWTTTPWTLPGNEALAVGSDIPYVKIAVGERYYIIAAERGEDWFVNTGTPYEVVGQLRGRDLVGKKYQPLFPYYAQLQKQYSDLFTVQPADFVTVAEGTGIAHIAGGYGEADYQLAQARHWPIIQHVGRNGKFVAEVTDFADQPAKPKADPTAADQKIIAWLKAHDSVFAVKPYTHSYPHCWRCETPLLNYAATSWFVKVTALKDKMLQHNQTIQWLPEHIKDGRFGKWLAGAKDWAISRDRYWGAPLPIWQADAGSTLCIGSRAELKELSGQELSDLHKQYIDTVVIERDGKTYRRIGAVLDCWFESGAMPFAQEHYPFKHKEKFETTFPAQFIAEGLDQTRGWFYTLMVLATALFDKPAFQHVVVNGLVLAEDGKKMSKRLQNYPEPSVVLEKYGADSLRFYLMGSPVVRAEDLRFSEKGIDLVMKKVLMTLWNVNIFYNLFADGVTPQPLAEPPHDIMDRWVLALLAQMTEQTTAAMERYDLAEATRLLEKLVQEISTWYVRRSRERFKAADHAEAISVLATALDTVVKILAPFTPFIAEQIYLELHPAAQAAGDSVHLQTWPAIPDGWRDDALLVAMASVRSAVEHILAEREAVGIKVRQPLAQATAPEIATLPEELLAVIRAEVNVKAVQSGNMVSLDTTITPELAAEGLLRELIRTINALRKQQKLTINDHVQLVYHTDDALVRAVFEQHAATLQAAVLAKTLTASPDVQLHQSTVNGAAVSFTLGQ